MSKNLERQNRDKEETIRFLENLKAIQKRPTMYFGKDYGYEQLVAFIYGYLLGSKLIDQNLETTVNIIHNEVNHRMFMQYKEDSRIIDIIKGKQAFDDYFKNLQEVIEEYYPEYLDIIATHN